MIARMTAFALLTCVASQALAIGAVQGKVVAVRVDSDGKGMVFFDKAIGGTPASHCVHAAYTSALGFNSNTAGGKSILAAALAAKATGDTITAYGTGTCDIYGNAWVEDMSYANVGF